MPAPPGTGDLAGRLAVNIHFTSDDRALAIARAAGFTAVRMDLGWAGIESKKGVYDFSAFEALVASLASRSMRLHLILVVALWSDAPGATVIVTVPAGVTGIDHLGAAAAFTDQAGTRAFDVREAAGPL